MSLTCSPSSLQQQDVLKNLIESITYVNSKSCDVPQVLDSLDLTVNSVPSIYLYIFEIIQNAIDASCDSIEITVYEDLKKMVIQHNGLDGLGKSDAHIKGMSNVFQSTKSIGSVGFMGFGFKTLYKRFCQVKVSDIQGWKFKFDVPEVLITANLKEREIKAGESNSIYTLSSRSWLGALTPQWDESAECPSTNFTTRFELSVPVSSTASIPLFDDVKLALFLSLDNINMTPLAVLATQKLKHLKIALHQSDPTRPDHVEDYELSYEQNQGIVQVIESTQLSSQNNNSSCHLRKSFWKTYETKFVPNEAATQCMAQARYKNILKHHKQLEEAIVAIQRPYTVIGLIPMKLHSNCSKVDGITLSDLVYCTLPAGSGQLFATLPIRAFLPFGISIQADWLLDLSRKGLRDIDTNPWQQCIIDEIGKIACLHIESIRNLPTQEEVNAAFSIFASSIDSKGNILSHSLAIPMDKICKSIQKFASTLNVVFPVVAHESDIPTAATSSSNEQNFMQSEFKESLITNTSSTAPQRVVWTKSDTIVLMPKTHYRPKKFSRLFGVQVLDEQLTTSSAAQFFLQIGIVRNLDIESIISRFISAKDGNSSQTRTTFQLWFASLNENNETARRMDLIELYAFFSEFAPAGVVPFLECIPCIQIGDWSSQGTNYPLQHDTSTSLKNVNTWCSPCDLVVLEHKSGFKDLPSAIDEPEAFRFLVPSLDSNWKFVWPSFLEFLLKQSGDWAGAGRIAYEWISKLWTKKSYQLVAKRSFMNTNLEINDLKLLISGELEKNVSLKLDRFDSSPQAEQAQFPSYLPKLLNLVKFTRFAINEGMVDLISHALTHKSGKLVELGFCLVSSPFVSQQQAESREALYKDWPRIHPVYNLITLPPKGVKVGFDHLMTWNELWVHLGAKGPASFEEYVFKEIAVHPSYSESRRQVGIEIEAERELSDFQTTSRRGWKVYDTKFSDVHQSLLENPNPSLPYIADWLEQGIKNLEKAEGAKFGHGEVWRVYIVQGRAGTSSWCQLLNNMHWVPLHGSSKLAKPSLSNPEAVRLSPQLVKLLTIKGVTFGTTVAQKSLLTKLSSYNAKTLIENASTDDLCKDEFLFAPFEALDTEIATLNPSQYPLIQSALENATLQTKDGQFVKFSNMIDLLPGSNVEELTLAGFLTPIHALNERILDVFTRMIRQAIIKVHHWPSSLHAQQCWLHISSSLLPSGDQSYSKHSQIISAQYCNVFPSLIEYLSADPFSCKEFLQHNFKTLLVPRQSVSNLNIDENDIRSSVSWVTLESLSEKIKMDIRCGSSEYTDDTLFGNNKRIRNFVVDLLLNLPTHTDRK